MMATPTRSQMASTPKNPSTTTPNRPTASPRTNLGMFAHKSLTGKSPAVKTPASQHSHTHKVSVSSHPTSTPLNASTDPLNMSTPAALMAGITNTGLTPLPTSQASFLGSNMNMLPSLQDGPAGKDPARDRYERLKQVLDTLMQNTAGRGISRESIEQLAKIHGFDIFHDEDEPLKISILGQAWVDLEIYMKSSSSSVVDKLALKLNEPGQDEGVLQEAASRVLLENLSPSRDSTVPWHDMTDFSKNLAYLGKLERIDGSTNSFQVIDNLYDAFQRIWVEEKKRLKWRHNLHHLTQSNVGWPTKDEDGKLGMRTRYWVSGRLLHSKDPEIEDTSAERADWTASFSLESGPPSLSASQSWLADEPLKSTARAENIFHETIDKPSWQDSLISPKIQPSKAEASMDVDKPEPSQQVDMHFICQLEPEILLPLQVAQQLNQISSIFVLHQASLTTYRQVLTGEISNSETLHKRWPKRTYTFTRESEAKELNLSYNVYSAGVQSQQSPWMHPIGRMKFSHPRQYAEALPALRQYALVGTLLQSIRPDQDVEVVDPPQTTESRTYSLPSRGKFVKRSNKPKADAELEALVNPRQQTSARKNTPLQVDVRVDSHSSTVNSCRIELRISLSTAFAPTSALQKLKAKAFLSIEFDVLLNGVVDVVSFRGIEMEKQKDTELRKKLAKVVRACEDISVIVAWTLRELGSM